MGAPPVSYLADAEAWRLVTHPGDDFALNYEPEAVERIIAQTGGQPYLVQQRRHEEWTLPELETATHLDGETLVRQLRWAQRHDVLRKIDGQESTWQFYVPLLRRWIRQFQSSRSRRGHDEARRRI